MKDLMKKIQAQALDSQPCYLVALIESEGSTPRTSGAYMLVGAKGLLYEPSAAAVWNTRRSSWHSSVCAAVAAALSKRLTFLRQQAWPAVEAARCSFVTCLWGKKWGIWQRKLLVQ